MQENELIPNLFRSEFSKIVSVLCKRFGIQNIQLAEDIASDTFLTATETWSLKGIPDNPKAWLYAVAKNKTRDFLKRNSLFDQKILPELRKNTEAEILGGVDLSEGNIEDSKLRMLFAICNPALSQQAQICLALRILCGLGIDEIASALLSTKSTINKRLVRAKETYRKQEIDIRLLSETELHERSENVLTILYLLFNEGYYSTTAEHNTKKHLCLEAISLLLLFLRKNNVPEANALMSLFCFHASRFEAREDELGNAILYEDQDTSKWNHDLIAKGEEYLQKSAFGNEITRYHLEATIAFWHTRTKPSNEKWENILQVYNHLLQLHYSPIAALNRTYALFKVKGRKIALNEALKIDLKNNHLYHALLAELYIGMDSEKELHHLELALKLSKTKSERKLLTGKIARLAPLLPTAVKNGRIK